MRSTKMPGVWMQSGLKLPASTISSTSTTVTLPAVAMLGWHIGYGIFGRIAYAFYGAVYAYFAYVWVVYQLAHIKILGKYVGIVGGFCTFQIQF